MRVKLFQLRGMLSGPRILYIHTYIYMLIQVIDHI
ncbi:unnamed protein product [Brassica oleracea var. botrytis]|uniref:(rape) hypothetical protein n=1 Tax=Brassica napus TaxID=3708 RepID=A0A816V6T3_BRANA|nr:unnamed protein product [Brassica napus]